MTIGPAPMCLFCKRFKEYWKCEAFDEIPMEIIRNEVDHRQPIGGETDGLFFEVADDPKTRAAFSEWSALVTFD